MKSSIVKQTIALLACAMCFGTACEDAVNSADEAVENQNSNAEDFSAKEEKADDAVSTPEAPKENHPLPVATLTMDEGQTVEFYDIDGHAFLIERGPAGVEPALKSLDENQNPGHFADVFRALRPDLAVPEALESIQTRVENTQVTEQVETEIVMNEEVITDHNPTNAYQLRAACNNGCCDYNWLKNSLCPKGGDDNWFLYNMGWSHVKRSGKDYYKDLVCAAVGTSTWTMTRCKNGCVQSTYSVPQATYLWFSDSDNWFFNVDFDAWVNSKSNMHLHTHCGKDNE
jgi:hypothetical protein